MAHSIVMRSCFCFHRLRISSCERELGVAKLKLLVKNKRGAQRCHQRCCGKVELPKSCRTWLSRSESKKVFGKFPGWASGRLGEAVTLGLAP